MSDTHTTQELPGAMLWDMARKLRTLDDLGWAMAEVEHMMVPDVDPQESYACLEELAAEAGEYLAGKTDTWSRVLGLCEFLGEVKGFEGDVGDYYDMRNSQLSQVIHRRKGIPITLAVIYIEVAKRLELPLVGVGFPFHFLVGINLPGQTLYIDPFEHGRIITLDDCSAMIEELTEGQLEFHRDLLRVVDERQILLRVLRNIKGLYARNNELDRAISCLDLLLTWEPEQPLEQRDRGLLHFHRGDWRAAIADLEAIIQAPQLEEEAPLLEAILTRARNRLAHAN